MKLYTYFITKGLVMYSHKNYTDMIDLCVSKYHINLCFIDPLYLIQGHLDCNT